MARPKKTSKIKIKQATQPPMGVKIQGLPGRPTLRVSEVAYYYGVTERTVYLWIENGHLKTVLTPAGQWRITRKSLDECRFKKPDYDIDSYRSSNFR